MCSICNTNIKPRSKAVEIMRHHLTDDKHIEAYGNVFFMEI